MIFLMSNNFCRTILLSLVAGLVVLHLLFADSLEMQII